MRIISLIFVILLSSCATKKTAEFYFQQGKNEAVQTNAYVAIENFTKAIKKNPNYIEAYMERASVNVSIDSLMNAIRDYDSVLVKTNKNDYENKGKLYLKKGDAYYGLSEDTLACRCYTDAKNMNNNTAWNRLRDRCKK